MRIGRRIWWIISGLCLLLCVGFILAAYRFGWSATGFLNRTLWDWLQLLIVPLVLAIVALLFQFSNSSTERQLALDKQREDILQAYLDRMSELLLEKNLGTSPTEEVRNVARVRTMTILTQLDARRIGYVFAFLGEAGLMSEQPNSSIVDLTKADLRSVNWTQAKLSRADLIGANLSHAHLSRADLSRAHLTYAVLRDADLSGANLWGANLTLAHLSGAHLSGADLRRADLSGADLNGADLTKANLNQADLSGANLSRANLCGADLSRADLNGADLSGAVCVNEVLSEKQLAHAKLDAKA